MALRSKMVLKVLTELPPFHQIHSVYNLENSKLPFSVHWYRHIVALEEAIEIPRRRLKKSSQSDFDKTQYSKNHYIKSARNSQTLKSHSLNVLP